MGKHSNIGNRTESQDVLDKDGNPIPGTEQSTNPEGGNTKNSEEPKDGFIVGMLRKCIRGFKWVNDRTPKPVKAIVTTAAIGGALYVAGREGYKLGVKSVKPLETTDTGEDADEEVDLDLLESEVPEGWNKYENEGVTYYTDDPEVQSQLDADPSFTKVEEA